MYRLILCISLLFALTSCGNEAKTEPDYEQTKQIIIDTLQTDEGKKALLDIISEDRLKQQLVIDNEFVKKTISETLMSKEGKYMWEQLFSDPEFVDNFNTAIAEEQVKMLKLLMKDATFQKQMMDLLQNPEMKEEVLKLLKSQQFQEHLEKTITETIDSPVYRSKLQKDLQNKDKQDKENKNKKKEDKVEEEDNDESEKSSEETETGNIGL